MRSLRTTSWVPLLSLGLLLGGPMAHAGPEPEETYTTAELAALDRALEAANLDRLDLTFRKDLAKGHEVLEVVRAMLHDPLEIAPQIDEFIHDVKQGEDVFHAPLGALLAAYDRAPTDEISLLRPLTQRGKLYPVVQYALGEGEKTHPAPAPTPAGLLEHLEGMARVGGEPLRLLRDFEEGQGPLDGDEPVACDDERYQLLRRYLPEQMAWHEVFDSPYDEATDKRLAAALKAGGEATIHELGSKIGVVEQIETWIMTFRDPVVWLKALPATCFPTDKPLVKDTPYGRIAIGTPGDDVYTGDYAALIDPGGNDRYVGCRIGAAYGTENQRVGFFADLGGDDVYECAEVNITLGAAVLGIAAFLDLGMGDDRYSGGHASLGAAMGGVAVFYDDGGSDLYEGRTFTQGAAGFGVGLFQDDALQDRPATTADEGTKEPVDISLFDNDSLRAWSNAQAFARCRGVALCVNSRGNDVYEAGGVYLHAPLFADRYQSFSQGFAIGERGIDYAGGIALIVDLEGNDRYLGDIYNQGVGYWYSAGLLYDGGGNDLYEMTQYGQGSGIHLAVGGLVDVDGNDTYVMHSGLGQGGSHDYAASILHDRGGNDHYMGMTSCNGCGLTNSVGLHIDRSGDDTYAGREGSLNSGRPARGFGSVGVLVDLAGTDHYLGIMKDETAWRHTDLGVGIDVPPAPEPEGKVQEKPKEAEGHVEIPAICSYEGPLTAEVFDELWAIAIRWEVGENRRIVPKARERLVAFGADVLPHLDRVMDKGASGLEFRAFQDVLAGVAKAGAEEGVTALIRRNLGAASEQRRKVALSLAGELKTKAVETEVVTLLGSKDAFLARRAAGVLEKLESHAGDEVLRTWLVEDEDGPSSENELRIIAALGTLLGLETPCYPALRPLLDEQPISVRSRLATLLAAHEAAYGEAVRKDLGAADLSPRARRTLLDVLARTKTVLPPDTRTALLGLLEDKVWGLRADAARVLQSQLALEELPEEARTAIAQALEARVAAETDPYVRFWLRAR